MAQHDYDIANQSFPSFRSDLNSVLEAINTSNSGTSRPSSAVNGTIWLDTTNATTPTLKLYDGTDDISLATFDYSANTVNWLDSTVSADLVNDLSPQLGGMLDVNGNAIGNGTEELIKFSETASAVNELTVTNSATGNAPEISATGDDTNIDFKLTPKGTGKLILDGLNFPTADGSADQVLKTDGAGNLSFTDVSGGVNTPSFQALLSANQVISDATLTKVAVNSELFDSDGCYNNTGSTTTLNGISVPSYSFAPNVSGKYFIFGSITFNPSGSDNIARAVMIFRKNGGDLSNLDYLANSSTYPSSFTIYQGIIADLNGTSDYVHMEAFLDASGTPEIRISGNGTESMTWFGAYKIIE